MLFRSTNVSLSEYYEVGEDLRVTWIAKDGTVLFDNDLDISQLPNHKNRPEVKTALFQGEGESVRRSDTMQMDNYYYALRLENGTVIRVATQARSVYSVFLAASPFVILILILIVSICIVLAHFLTKQLLHPIERLAENMEDTIEEPVYKELVPFVNTIRKQHENILMAAKVRLDFLCKTGLLLRIYHMVFVDDKPVELTFKEYELLRLLMTNPSVVLSREVIMRHVWGTEFEGESRTVDMHIKTLRQKLGEIGRAHV